MIKEDWLLFIEPSGNRTLEPVIDSRTKKITAALRKAEKGVQHYRNKYCDNEEWVDDFYMGYHTDACGCVSACSDRRLPNGRVTNTLAIHYVAFHRHEIPHEQLLEIDNLTEGEEEPTIKELWPGWKEK